MQRCIVALVAMMLAGPAFADGITGRSKIASPFLDAPREWSWSGVYLDLGVGGQATIADFSARETGEDPSPNSLFLNGLGAWDWAGNARVGFNVQPQNSPFVFGVFAGYSLGSMVIEGGIAGPGAASIQGELTPTWDFGAIVGLVGPGKSLLYGGYRYQMAEFDLRGSGGAEAFFDTACASETGIRCSHDLEGHGLVAGIKMPMGPALVIGIEYGYTRFDDIELSRNEGTSVRLDPEVHTIMLRGSVLLGQNLFGQ